MQAWAPGVVRHMLLCTHTHTLCTHTHTHTQQEKQRRDDKRRHPSATWACVRVIRIPGTLAATGVFVLCLSPLFWQSVTVPPQGPTHAPARPIFTRTTGPRNGSLLAAQEALHGAAVARDFGTDWRTRRERENSAPPGLCSTVRPFATRNSPCPSNLTADKGKHTQPPSFPLTVSCKNKPSVPTGRPAHETRVRVVCCSASCT